MLRSVTALFVLFAFSLQFSLAGDSLVAPGGKVQKLADGFAFTEGPAADADGNVYFSDVRNSRIHRWSTDGELSTHREDTGRANGLFFTKDGNLLACEGGARRVTLQNLKTGKLSVLADEYQGKKLNSPNDLWIDSEGGIYFTDPRYGSMEGLELDGFHVFYIPADRSQPLQLVLDDLVKPNGIIGTADGKQLYVTDPGDKKTYVYDIKGPGKLANKKLFCENGSDGMTLDEQGNLYLTSGAVVIYNPDGKLIEEIEFPEAPANVTFGGKDDKTLFVTARTGFYSIPMQVTGQ